ncbi:MAG: cytochrome c biogenesis CcdA family protein [Hyphomicrobiales bacterium]|nr:cytochrome c biogenesis CcdA family protein [Hyphomicrobiales bacterium]
MVGAAPLLGFAAGLLSILSPCVLPVLPLVLTAALSQHKLGPLALALGLALSFVTLGMFIALAGFSLGLDQAWFQNVAAVLLMILGVILLVPMLQERVSQAGGPFANWAQQRFGRLAGEGLGGQFGVGVLLGAVWAPCAGPTLGAASLLAAQGKDLGMAALVMAAFGLGTALPLVALGMLSREVLVRWRGAMSAAGTLSRQVMGGVFMIAGVLILSGLEQNLESWLTNASPAALTRLTTHI